MSRPGICLVDPRSPAALLLMATRGRRWAVGREREGEEKRWWWGWIGFKGRKGR